MMKYRAIFCFLAIRFCIIKLQRVAEHRVKWTPIHHTMRQHLQQDISRCDGKNLQKIKLN